MPLILCYALMVQMITLLNHCKCKSFLDYVQAVEGRSSAPPSMQTAEAVLALMGIQSVEDQGTVVMEGKHWWQPELVTSDTEQALSLLTRGFSSISSLSVVSCFCLMPKGSLKATANGPLNVAF